MKIETMMWLLPIVFMLHDFEEIIMFRPWLDKNRDLLARRFPWLVNKVLPTYVQMSTSGFAFAVAIIFLLISAVTFVSVELNLTALWMGVFLVFAIHLIFHVIQYLIFSSYVPVIISSALSFLYCGYVIYYWQYLPPVSSLSLLGWFSAVLFAAIVLVPTSLWFAKKWVL
jgi:hypothetical protein